MLLCNAGNALELKIEPWTSSCVEVGVDKSLDCTLPKAVPVEPLLYQLPHSNLQPGEAKSHRLSHKFKHGPIEPFYELRVFEVFPKQGLRYYQLQLEWIFPSRATCILSVDASKDRWSPMSCVGVDKSLNRWGLNVSVGGVP